MGLPAVQARELANSVCQLQLFVEDQDVHGLPSKLLRNPHAMTQGNIDRYLELGRKQNPSVRLQFLSVRPPSLVQEVTHALAESGLD